MPHLENGYTQIANEIMEALVKYRIPGEQMQCLLFILRKTYGWKKKEDSIALSQFVEATGIKKQNICRAVRDLVDKNVVIKKDNRAISTYSFNKRYKTWKALSKKITVIKKDNLPLSKKRHTKETIQKKRDLCPHDDIINLYHTLLGDLPKVRVWTKEREKKLQARWDSGLQTQKGVKINTIEFWEIFFKYINDSDYLMGRVKKWRAKLEWIVTKSKFIKIYEGDYHD